MNKSSSRIPQSQDDFFYSLRDFKKVGIPLVYTEERMELTPIDEQGILELDGLYAISIKRDGKFIRVIKKGTLFRMITSGGRDFYHNKLAEVMKDMKDGQYNMELIHGDGLLASRQGTGFLTTAYTKYSKEDLTAGDWPGEGVLRFEIHDYLQPNADGVGYDLDMPYQIRRSKIFDCLPVQDTTKPVLLDVCKAKWVDDLAHYQHLKTLEEDLAYTLGYYCTLHEGLVIQRADASYRLPINLQSYKFKNVLELTGTVLDTELNVDGGHNTLIVDVDGGKGKESICRVSSGINDKIRGMEQSDIVGKRVEVEYESITKNGEYQMPRIKRFDV